MYEVMGYEEFVSMMDSYQAVPVYMEIPSDMLTLTMLIKKFFKKEDFFVLESANTKKAFSRFSYFGFPEKVFVNASDPFRIMEREVIFKAPFIDKIGGFSGGIVGYIGFEAVSKIGILRKPIIDDAQAPESVLFLSRDFVVFDNLTQRAFVVHVCLNNGRDTLKYHYNHALDRLSFLKEKITSCMHDCDFLEDKKYTVDDIEWELEDKDYLDRVDSIRGLIAAGEAIQVVFSQKVDIHGFLDPVSFYRALRKINPSPYMFFISYSDSVVCGASPEVHLKVYANKALMKPIAGTYPVSKIAADELLRDEKELAEHLMLLDLTRNDLYTSCYPESVKVLKYMKPERYSHVVHIVSTVVGRLKKNIHPVELLKYTFPAGTVSGAPKIRAIEIIKEYELSRRGFYSGCVGYLSYNGWLDTAITIRSAKFSSNKAVLRAGSGIVYESSPERELAEVKNKLAALFYAFEMSHGGVSNAVARR